MNLRAVIALVILGLVTASAHGQTLTTGQISGTVTDPSGAVVPKAQVTVSNTNTGIKRTTESNSDGYYLVPLLDPGNYVVTIAAKGFETVSREGITVAVSRSALVDFRLQIGAEEIKVTISTDAPLIEPSNPNTTTTLNATQLANIPNPGNDLSYIANLAPGALMNTTSTFGIGSGKVEFNGLPSLGNDFSIDGLDANNPFLNTNATGASGLQLGMNAIEEVSVNTASYSVDQGRQDAAQINYITKSGTNNLHGNAYEIWNGSAMNARNFFNNLKGITKKPRSNVNEFGASVGGPIVKNKLFFFTEFEGIRIVLPTTFTSTLSTAAYQTYVLQQLPLGGNDTVLPFPPFSPLPPQPGEVQLYKNMFSLMGDTSGGIPLAVLGCPFDVGGGSPATANDGNGCATQKTSSVSPPASETLFTAKLDYTLSPSDTLWFRFQVNNGTHITPDPVNSIFDTKLSGPNRSGAAGWTHVFSPKLVNQFNPGLTYNSFTSDIADPSTARTLLPITYLVPPFTLIGGSQFALPMGTASTVWQLNDNLTWSRGKHSLKFGENMRRVLISATTNSLFAIPLEVGCSLPEFTFGATCSSTQNFPKILGDRIAATNLDLYAMDTFRATQRLTITIGLRTAWNSNPVSEHNNFSRLSGSFSTISHDVNEPLNKIIAANQRQAFESTQLLQWQPRAALAYEIRPRTLLRAGFGIFATTLEGALAPLELSANAPLDPQFKGGILGPAGGIAIAPGVPGSAVDAGVAANQQFQAGFASGELSCSSPQASRGNCLPTVGFNAFSGGRQRYPYSMQWSAVIERQFGNDVGLNVRYLGTRALQMLYQTFPNGFQNWCQGCFASLPFQTAPDSRFAGVSSFNTGANSSYHALQVTGQKRMRHGLALQLNYTYSHCLDTVSNGGLFAFNTPSNSVPLGGNLRRYYGNCDFDVTHSLNGWYVYELPVHPKRAWLDDVIGGWQVSGVVFLRGGFPLSVYSGGTSVRFINGTPTIYANSVPGQNAYAKSAIPGVTQPGTIQWLNPNAFQSVIDTSTFSCFPTTNVQNCQNGNLGRNTLRAPGFRWADLDIGKRFKVSEKIGFRFDAQFYNVFNHPNFYYPNFGSPRAGIPGKPATLTGFGTISQTASPATGLLGGALGGDSSVRMIAFKGRIEF